MSATAKHVQLQNAGQFHTLYIAKLGYAKKKSKYLLLFNNNENFAYSYVYFLTISIQEVQLWYISGKITLYQVTVGKLDGNFFTGYLQVPLMCLPTCNVLNFRAIKAINKHGLHWKRTQLIGPPKKGKCRSTKVWLKLTRNLIGRAVCTGTDGWRNECIRSLMFGH